MVIPSLVFFFLLFFFTCSFSIYFYVWGRYPVVFKRLLLSQGSLLVVSGDHMWYQGWKLLSYLKLKNEDQSNITMVGLNGREKLSEKSG